MLFEAVRAECGHRRWPFLYVSCKEMYQAIEAIRRCEDPGAALKRLELTGSMSKK
jgi:hypothetical protein